MECPKPQLQRLLSRFLSEEAGLATIDWVLMCSCATGAGMIALSMGQQGFGQYSADVRDEMQSPYFDTSWTESLEIPPQEVWGDHGQVDPTSGDGGTSGPDDGGNGDDDQGTDDPAPPDDGGPDGGGGGNNDDADGGADGDTADGDTDPNGGNGGNGGGTTPPQLITTELDVTNPGFEVTDHDDGEWSSGLPGWSVQTSGSADAGDFNPGDWSLDPGYITGDNVAYLYNGNGWSSTSISQTLGETYSASAIYEIAVDIGDATYSFSGDQSYTVTLYAGSTVIGSVSGSTGDMDALQTVTLTSSVSDASLNGESIRLEITHPDGSSGDLIVDNVRGTVTAPAPVDPVRTIPPAPVQGCPDNAAFGGPVSVRSGDELDDRDLLIDVTVGGTSSMQIGGACPGVPGHGYFHANPTFTLELSGMHDMEELEIETNGTRCDTVLLVRDQQGNWYFDDDGGPGLESRLKFREDDFDMSQFNGLVDVWVGTYGGESCSFEMEIDTIG